MKNLFSFLEKNKLKSICELFYDNFNKIEIENIKKHRKNYKNLYIKNLVVQLQIFIK